MGDYSKMGPNEQKTYNNCEHKNISMVIDGVLLRVDTYYKNLGKGCGVVCGEVGAYIMDEYRDKGIGSNFIQMISEYCIHNNISCAHVPWETANPYANRFWRKFFTPTVLS